MLCGNSLYGVLDRKDIVCGLQGIRVTEIDLVLAERNLEDARELAEDDEVMDELRSEQFRVILGDDWTGGVESAVDVALLGRYYERIADHTTNIAEWTIYLVTGQRRRKK